MNMKKEEEEKMMMMISSIHVSGWSSVLHMHD